MKTNADFKTINALLKKDALTAAEDGTLQISADDMKAIEKRITDLEESEKNLKEKVEAFDKADGAADDGVVVDDDKDDSKLIMDDYNAIKHIL